MTVFLRWLERFFWLAGFAAIGYVGYVYLESRYEQASRSKELEQVLREKPAPETPAPAPPPRPEPGSTIGRLEIPRIGVSVVVLEGSDDHTLRLGVGHLSNTSLPGERGNVVFAAHRDTFFRPLRAIRKEDLITVTTAQGDHRYAVESTEVVDPDAAEVLHASSQPVLTLITCYPFYYVGHAPKRFVVKARELIEEPAPKPEPSVIAQAAPPEPVVSKPLRRAGRRVRSETALEREAYSLPRAAGPKKPQEAPQSLEVIDLKPKLPTESLAEQAKAVAPPEQEGTAAEASQAEPAVQNGRQLIRGIRRLNPARLFGRLGRLVRRPEQPNTSQPEEALP